MRFDFEFKIVFPTTFGLIMVYPDKFARISYENFGQFDKIREIANNCMSHHPPLVFFGSPNFGHELFFVGVFFLTCIISWSSSSISNWCDS